MKNSGKFIKDFLKVNLDRKKNLKKTFYKEIISNQSKVYSFKNIKRKEKIPNNFLLKKKKQIKPSLKIQ
jgi:hypothetical protein